MSFRWVILFGLLSAATPIAAQDEKPFDAAAAFGARPSVSALSLSPDGLRVAYIAPTAGQGSALYTVELTKDAIPRAAFSVNGKPDRLGKCEWVSNARVVCVIYGAANSGLLEILPFTRLVAVNSDSSNPTLLSTKSNLYTRGVQLGGGNIIDWRFEPDGMFRED
jgi:hypothetical protein